MTYKIYINKYDDAYVLHIKTDMSDHPCGWRLKKDGKFPLDKFWFDSKLEAEKAMGLLQKYVDDPINMTEHRERKKEKYVEERETIFG
jgi:hypothetical protein